MVINDESMRSQKLQPSSVYCPFDSIRNRVLIAGAKVNHGEHREGVSKPKRTSIGSQGRNQLQADDEISRAHTRPLERISDARA